MTLINLFKKTQTTVIVILLSLSSICSAQKSQIENLTFGDSIGLGVHFSQGETPDHLNNLTDLGIRWIRDNEGWPTLEPETGKYVLPERLIKRLEFYKKNNIGIIFGLWGTNNKAYPNDPYDAEAYGQFARKMAELLTQADVEFVLELWNEPHNNGLGQNLEGSWDARPLSPWADKYVAMVNSAIKHIMDFDPTIKVMLDEDVWVAHYWFLEQGIDPRMQAAAIHPYVHGPTPGPETAHFGPDVEWAGPFTIIDEDRSFRSIIKHLSNQYEKKLGHTVEFWSTEWGYRIGAKMSDDQRVTEDLAAAMLTRLYVISYAANVRCTCWHVLQDMSDGPFGLIRNDQTKRPAYQAFKNMSKQLSPYRLVRQISGNDHPTSGVQAFLFYGPKGHKVVAWSIEGEQDVTIDTNDSAIMRITNNMGTRVNFRYVETGMPAVTLTKAPVYITGILDDCKIEKVEK